MKRSTFLLTVFCLLTNWMSLQAQVFKNKDLAITKLEKDMWVVETTDMTTMYIIEGTKKAMLIDTGTKCEKLDSIVGLVTKKPLYVVVTHAHGDHAGNIRYFKEIYLHQSDMSLLDPSYKGKVNFVKDGDVFDLGGKKIEVKHMPAHTPGSIVLIDKKAGNCYSGDAFGSNQVWLQLKPYSPMKTYIESCEKMEKLMDEGITKIYCGHYPYVKKAYNKQYITEMRTLAEQLVNGTAPKAEPHPQKVSIGSEHPMMVTLGGATIVFDPEHIR
ncbi:MAG: MBL fold metallo-hydrolase [Methylococcaceae bacterium]|nr:MBL fold metallo-hydrolase [Prolixibacteraceae bacterium]